MANTAVTRERNASAAATVTATATAAYSYILPLISVAALTALDQLTKAIIRSNLDPSHSISLPATFGLLQIVHISNTGAIFGVLKGTQLLLSALSVAVVAFLAINYRKLGKRLQKLGALFITAGAVGNTIDRLVFGRVTDFIYVRPWPAFNLADAFLFLGAAFTILSLIRLRWLPAAAASSNRKGKKKKGKK